MNKEKSQSKEAQSDRANDLKHIHGIGPGIETRLNKAGILTYSQLAALSPDEIVSSLGSMIGMTTERVINQDWAGQARELAEMQEQGKSQTDEEHESPSFRKHYATFTVELLLADDNQVRRTRTTHFQSEAQETWVGWDQNRIIHFMSGCAELRLPEPEKEAPVEVVATPPPAPVKLAGEPKLTELLSIPVGGTNSRHVMPRDQSFGVTITLDLTETTSPQDTPLTYCLDICAHNLKNKERRTIAEKEGDFLFSDRIQFQLDDLHLDVGTYRLDAAITVSTPGDETQKLKAFTDGGLLYIY
jgi:hypothetical protein